MFLFKYVSLLSDSKSYFFMLKYPLSRLDWQLYKIQKNAQEKCWPILERRVCLFIYLFWNGINPIS